MDSKCGFGGGWVVGNYDLFLGSFCPKKVCLVVGLLFLMNCINLLNELESIRYL